MLPQRQFPPTAPRRGPGPVGVAPPQPPPGLSQQQFAQQTEEHRRGREAAELAKRRSQKPVDRNLPTGTEDLVIGDGVDLYKSLRGVERKLDAVIMRKRLDIQDTVLRTPAQHGTMRLWISNTAENQPWQATAMDAEAFDFSSGVDATYRVKIEGRLIESEDVDSLQTNGPENGSKAGSGDGEPAAKRAKLAPTAGRRKKLSHFFRSITIDFDRPSSLQPDNYNRIEWKRPDLQPSQADLPKEADFDTLEFERKSDENINITINLVRASADRQPDKYRLAPPLAELLDLEEADRKTVTMGLWEYIKANGLQSEGDERRVTCDESLRKLFNVDFFSFPQVSDFIRPHMLQPAPIVLKYTIRVDREFHSAGTPVPTIYDVPVPLEDALRGQMDAIIHSPTHTPTLQNITAIDDRIALIVQKMNEVKAKHAFFTSMSKDPSTFITRWISSQKRDLDVILGAGAWGEEDWQGAEWRKGGSDGPWGTEEAWEGIGTYLHRVQKTVTNTS